TGVATNAPDTPLAVAPCATADRCPVERGVGLSGRWPATGTPGVHALLLWHVWQRCSQHLAGVDSAGAVAPCHRVPDEAPGRAHRWAGRRVPADEGVPRDERSRHRQGTVPSPLVDLDPAKGD